MKALLFSGGIDSTCLAYEHRPERLVFVDYGQIPARGELRACEAIAVALELPLHVLTCDLKKLGSGLMAGSPQKVARQPEFWPFRNQMLVTLAAMALSSEAFRTLMIGTVSTDRHHPDGSPTFIEALDRTLACQSDLALAAPAADLTSEELILRTKAPADLLGWTFSCHTGEWPCGQCNGCRKHVDTKRALNLV